MRDGIDWKVRREFVTFAKVLGGMSACSLVVGGQTEYAAVHLVDADNAVAERRDVDKRRNGASMLEGKRNNKEEGQRG